MTAYTVSEINRRIREALEQPELRDVCVRGEVSNFKRYPSGHCYFSLKDSAAAIACVMFKGAAARLRFAPENGTQALVVGAVGYYERDGKCQLVVASMTPEGIGNLAMAFEQLKAKLGAEGLFAAERKRPLPRFPRAIGVVTSSAGAVLHDIRRVAKRRNPRVQIVLYPSAVQGEGAAEQLASGLDYFNAPATRAALPVDVIIVGRGGGSMEDLWAFNEEPVARAIARSEIPVISAVGHETDFSIADMVADVRAATPSVAAELAVPDSGELARQLLARLTQLARLRDRWLAARRERLNALTSRPCLRQPTTLLAAPRQRLDALAERLHRAGQQARQAKRARLDQLTAQLDLTSPVRVLRRGYGLMRDERGLAVRSILQIYTGKRLEVTLADGAFQATVTGKGKLNDPGL